MAREKKGGLSATAFYKHLAIVGVVTYVMQLDWTSWKIPLAITLAHGFIDWGKSRIKDDSLTLFLMDQCLHLVSIVACWGYFFHPSTSELIQRLATLVNTPDHLMIILGYILITTPSGVLIGYLTRRWHLEMSVPTTDPEEEPFDSNYATESSSKRFIKRLFVRKPESQSETTTDEGSTTSTTGEEDESLKDAGKWIGIIERILVLTFILMGEWKAIGYLIAAKSVFRFGELKKPNDRKRTEYILIGTLLSLIFAVGVGIAISHLVKATT